MVEHLPHRTKRPSSWRSRVGSARNSEHRGGEWFVAAFRALDRRLTQGRVEERSESLFHGLVIGQIREVEFLEMLVMTPISAMLAQDRAERLHVQASFLCA